MPTGVLSLAEAFSPALYQLIILLAEITSVQIGREDERRSSHHVRKQEQTKAFWSFCFFVATSYRQAPYSYDLLQTYYSSGGGRACRQTSCEK